jgi:hypothetical protein
MPDDIENLKHAVFGELTWNSELGWFEGRTTCGDMVCDVHVSVDDEEAPHGSTGEAVPALERARGRVSEFKAKAAEQLLELYNDEWRNEGESTKSADEFIAHLQLDSLSGYPDGTVEVSFTVGELFAGHIVLMSVESDGSVSQVDIAG